MFVSTLVALLSILAVLAAIGPQEPSTRFPMVDEVVTVQDVADELRALADEMSEFPEVQREFEQLAQRYNLPAERVKDYARVKLAFESTRDGGFWHLRWDITHRSPNSDAIWEQWENAVPWSEQGLPHPTAVAECDELSALFAFWARRLGVDRVGLFWPVWNHVVAVWTVTDLDGHDVRIVIPTSQIFLEKDDTLDTRRFNPYRQKTIYTYRRRDVPSTHSLNPALANFLLTQAHRWARSSLLETQRLRNLRSQIMHGS